MAKADPVLLGVLAWFSNGKWTSRNDAFALANCEQLVRRSVFDLVECAGGPVHEDQIHTLRAAQSKVKARVAGRKIAAAGARFISLSHCTCGDLHARAEAIAV